VIRGLNIMSSAKTLATHQQLHVDRTKINSRYQGFEQVICSG
jgi:hypothetical protein